MNEAAFHGIKSGAWFKGLPDEAIESLTQTCSVHVLLKGDVIYGIGDARTSVYGIINGSVRASMVGINKQEFALIDFYDNSWFGESALLENQSKIVNVTALEQTVVIEVPGKSVLFIAEEYPQMYKNLYFDKLRYMQLFYDVLNGLLTYPLKARLAMKLLSVLEQKGEVTENGVLLSPKLDLNVWSRLAMGSLQRVTLVYDEWIDDGIIKEKKGSWLIPDTKTLQDEVNK